MANSSLREFEEESKQYKRLEAASAMINAFTDIETTVETIYFDYGQDWMFTTVISDYQVLTPAMQELIVNGSLDNFNEAIKEVVQKINERGW